MATLKDIARECGVSANTVSSVLNNKRGEVSEPTRKRVMEAVRRLRYRPSAAARRMLGKSTNTIGIADIYSPHTSVDYYKAGIIEPLIYTARTERWDVLYYSGHAEEGRFPAFLDGRSDGLICFTGRINTEEVHAILASDIPVVFIGEPREEEPEPRRAYIDIDNPAGGYMATMHLCELGHRRIGMMQGIGVSGNLGRVAGYRRALFERGIAPNEQWIYPTEANEHSGYHQGIKLLEQPASERPTAIFCFHDGLAFGLLRAAEEMDVRVPGELSVIGFDDQMPALSTSPPLTTIRQPLDYIGQRSAEILSGIIRGSLPREHTEIVPPELIVRASTAPPASVDSGDGRPDAS